MRRRITIGVVAALTGALVAGALTIPSGEGLSLAPPALAQGGPSAGQGPGPGPGLHHGGTPMGAGLREAMQPIADLLGMQPREIAEAHRAGRSLADIAAERGVDQATLLQTITGAARTRLDQAVADGRLTRGQADALLNVVQQFAPDMITRAEPPGAALRGRGPGHGPRAGRQPGEAGPGPRAGQQGPGGPLGGPAALQPVADLLGLTPAEIVQERQTGRSLADIAAARGVDQPTLVRTIADAAKTRLDQAVASGRLPQERADAMAARIQERAEQMVTRTETPGAQMRERMRERGDRPGPGGRGPRGAETPAQ